MNVEPTGPHAIVTGAIRQAAQLTGASFKYLLATAQVESNLNPNAQVSTSSAKGLFQFIDQTWLATLKELGPSLGYGPYADAIARTPAGDYAVADPKMAKAVMNLRADPNASALMAGAFTKANGEKLSARLGRDPTEGELYIAHFLGSIGAGRLISLADSSPRTPAATAFPNAARANPSIFYDRHGQARSVSDVYRTLVARYQYARGASASMAALAASKAEQGAGKAEQAPLQPGAAPLVPFSAAEQTIQPAAAPGARPAEQPGSGSAPKTFVDAVPVARRGSDGARPVFHSLFRTGSEPIAPIVNALWSSPAAGTAPASSAPAPATPAPSAAPGAPPAPSSSGAFDLFQDQVPDVSALFRGKV